MDISKQLIVLFNALAQDSKHLSNNIANNRMYIGGNIQFCSAYCVVGIESVSKAVLESSVPCILVSGGGNSEYEIAVPEFLYSDIIAIFDKLSAHQ